MNRITIQGVNKETGKLETSVSYERSQQKRIDKAIERAERRGYTVVIKDNSGWMNIR